MSTFELTVHPQTRSTIVDRVEARVLPLTATNLLITYFVFGRVGSLRLPTPAPSERHDELWKHSCFEAFVGSAASDAYCELNFSPSSEWAAYAFSSYRAGMKPLKDFRRPAISLRTLNGAWWECRVKLGLGALAGLGPRPWRLGLSAVLEEKDGTRSYWALRHPPGAPDFHHRDCFALELPAPAAP
jgi:hypothetical protein